MIRFKDSLRIPARKEQPQIKLQVWYERYGYVGSYTETKLSKKIK